MGIVSYVQNEMIGGRIPLCPMNKCNVELSKRITDRLQILDRQSPYRARLKELIYQKNKFYCSKCGEWHHDCLSFGWSTCGHQYSVHCAKQIVDTHLPKSKSIWNALQSQSIPTCVVENCNAPILFSDAATVGLSEY